MPVTIKFDPTSTQLQADIIPDASCFNDGVLSAALACKLINMPTGGAGGNGETVFVFRPGAVDPLASNVFNDWSLLMAAVDGKQGLRTIQFDDSIVSPCVVPAGTWNMTNVLWSGTSLTTNPALPENVQVIEGAVLPGLRIIDRLRVNFTGSTPPITDFIAGQIALLSVQNYSSLTCSGAGPFIRNSVLGAYSGIAVSKYGQVITGTAPVMDIAVAGAVGIVGAFEVGGIQPNTISGVNGSNIDKVTLASSARVSDDQPAYLGTAAHELLSLMRLAPTNIVLTAGPQQANINQLLRCDLSLGDIDISMPPAFDNRGMWVVVKNLDPNPSAFDITILPAGGDTIDGGASIVFDTPKGVVRLVSDGISDWIQV